MHASALNGQLPVSTPTNPLVELAHLNNSDRPFISCYLDMRKGLAYCLSFLNRKAAQIRAALSGVDRLEFDSAIEVIRRSLEQVQREGVRGIAVFTRGAPTDRHLTLVKTASSPGNRLVYSRSAEILPMLALHQAETQARGNLLLARDGRLALLRLDPDTHHASRHEIEIMPRPAWANLKATHRALSKTGRFGMSAGEPERALREILVASSEPLLVATDKQTLAAITSWLPDEVTDRLIGCIPLTGDKASLEALRERARHRLAATCQADMKRRVDALFDRQRSDHALLGFQAVIDAVRRGVADTVLLSDWDNFGHGLPWESKIEVCLETLRHNARILLCDSLVLRQAGGVGCMLRQGCPAVPRRLAAETNLMKAVA